MNTSMSKARRTLALPRTLLKKYGRGTFFSHPHDAEWKSSLQSHKWATANLWMTILVTVALRWLITAIIWLTGLGLISSVLEDTSINSVRVYKTHGINIQTIIWYYDVWMRSIKGRKCDHRIIRINSAKNLKWWTIMLSLCCRYKLTHKPPAVICSDWHFTTKCFCKNLHLDQLIFLGCSDWLA